MEPSPGRYIFNSTCNNIISLSHLKLQHFWFNCKYICIECWKSLVQIQPDQNGYLLHYKNSSTVFFWFSAKQTSSDWRSYLFQTSSDWRSYLFQTSSDWRSYLFQTSSDWRSYLFQTSSDWRSYLFQTLSDWRSYLFQTSLIEEVTCSRHHWLKKLLVPDIIDWRFLYPFVYKAKTARHIRIANKN